MPFKGHQLESGTNRYGSLIRWTESPSTGIDSGANALVVEVGYHNCSELAVLIPGASVLNATQPLTLQLQVRLQTQFYTFATLSVPIGSPFPAFLQSFHIVGQAVRATLTTDPIDDGNNVQARLILMGSA